MASYNPMKKNTAQRIVFPILDADGDPVTGAAGLDSEYSLDGASFADLADEAHEIATASGVYYLDLAQGETNGDVVAIQVKTSTSGAKTTVLVFYTQSTNLDLVKAETAAIKAKTDIIGASVALETGGNLATIAGKLPTNKIMGSSVVTDKDDEIDAIKAKTDLIGASVALESAGNLAAVKAKTDTLPASPANEATFTHATYGIDKIKTETAAIKAKTDLIGASIALESGGNLAAVKAKTDNLPSDPADESLLEAAIIAAHATTNGKIDVVDGIVDTMLTHTTALKKIGVNKWAIVDTSFIIYDDDDVTPLYTFTLDSATEPTSRTPA